MPRLTVRPAGRRARAGFFLTSISSGRRKTGADFAARLGAALLLFRRRERFFSRSGRRLRGTSYRAFPNVRLNDLFTIDDPAQRGAVLGRLRDKHVDFIIVDAADHFRPRLAIELDGKSHQKAEQQYRDSVKDVIFRSGGLTLLRLPSRRYSVAELRNELRRAGLKSGN
ncbi:DUF2726 domain-containing protein [Deinococcus radiodurans]|uniref:DUF2726 domain-containing protein n=1 Tax=Deinococcus radiodurans (strain ATCC 13939 / DSM 20539 / JCM 16871 / CCUG 27074 / LMG 4051 / NBRC 15346 / NCIMB 9279 / VKM B-1422 / R1) TaxID=243230 RepID=Q9RRC6_DEIRA|nr:DUF2726 domain-containing protein [Deinococcus radiodurans]AAF12108.1 hypothetical protein DR_2566 [Deinococcus radiodurans R1 = ATCC 13939 = DSM 20539]